MRWCSSWLLLEGFDAERLVRRFGPLPAERVIHVVRQMCHSLSEAESVGLVHRDIKPANIILCRYGEDYDFVKLLDFGIVKALHDPVGNDAGPTLTVEHAVAGHAGVHRTGAGAGCGRGQPSGHLRDRMRRLLAADGAACLHRRYADAAASAPRSHAAQPAIVADRAPDSTGA